MLIKRLLRLMFGAYKQVQQLVNSQPALLSRMHIGIAASGLHSKTRFSDLTLVLPITGLCNGDVDERASHADHGCWCTT